MDNRAIGIFDSGLGGLTVVKEMTHILKEQKIIYFGDTARVPYGTKSKDTVVNYAKQDVAFLKDKSVKMIIAACGTVSSNLDLKTIEEFSIPFIGVVLPAVEAAISLTKTKKIGVLGTPSTIKSNKYEKEILKNLKDAKVKSVACPMFVPLVENGYIKKDDQVSNIIAKEYLKPFIKGEYDVIILGCTHFPILSDVIKNILPSNIRLINPGKEAAKYAKEMMKKQGILPSENPHVTHEFYSSDDVNNFINNANLFLKNDDLISSSIFKHYKI